MKSEDTKAAVCPKLVKLADACLVGACNTFSLIISLGEAVKELEPYETRFNPAVKIIIGQISFLMKESLGPTPDTLQEYEKWKRQT